MTLGRRRRRQRSPGPINPMMPIDFFSPLSIPRLYPHMNTDFGRPLLGSLGRLDVQYSEVLNRRRYLNKILYFRNLKSYIIQRGCLPPQPPFSIFDPVPARESPSSLLFSSHLPSPFPFKSSSSAASNWNDEGRGSGEKETFLGSRAQGQKCPRGRERNSDAKEGKSNYQSVSLLLFSLSRFSLHATFFLECSFFFFPPPSPHAFLPHPPNQPTLFWRRGDK